MSVDDVQRIYNLRRKFKLDKIKKKWKYTTYQLLKKKKLIFIIKNTIDLHCY